MMNNSSNYDINKYYDKSYFDIEGEYNEFKLPLYHIQDSYILDPNLRLNNRNLYHNKNKCKKEDIKIYDNLLDDAILKKILHFCKNTPMLMEHASIDPYKISVIKKKSPYKYTHLMWPSFSMKFNRINVIYNVFFNKIFFEYILPNIDIKNKENISINRAYINSHILGISGLFHKDGKSIYEKNKYDTAPTVLLYINDDWDKNYDGTTGFMLDDDDISNIHHVEFKKGRILLMPSYISHKMCGTSTHSYRKSCLRYVLAYHLIYNQTIDKY